MLRHALLVGSMFGLLVLSTASSAQAQFGRGFNIPPSVQNLFMLRDQAVQKELALDEGQTKGINELAAQMQAEAMEVMSGLQDLTPEEQKQELPSIMKMVGEKGKEIQEKVDKVLNEKQRVRVKELSIQRRGVEALQDDEVIEALKLSDEQKQKLTAIRDEIADKQQAIFKDAGGDRQQMREKFLALRKEAGESAMAILTSDQREQFDKMKGPKFDFPQGGNRRGLF
jgi:hypothetical protein